MWPFARPRVRRRDAVGAETEQGGALSFAIMPRSFPRRWPAALDGACDGLVLAFATWTGFYQLALVGQFSLLWAAWPWVVLTACLMVGYGLRATRARGCEPSDARDGLVAPQSVPTRRVETAVILLGLGLLAVLTARRAAWGVWPIAVAGLVVLLVQLLPRVVLRGRDRDGATNDLPAGPSGRAHLFALACSLGYGALGMFLLRPDADDAYYVNRAAWVATHGTAALNDTMYGPETRPAAIDGGLPTPSIEALQGAMAHALGIQAPTLCYLVAVPLLGALAGWTTWRLVRAWSPRRPVLVMAVSMLFLVASADSIVGNYSLGRIWQGKVIAYTILIPLVWLLLSRAASRTRRADHVLLAAAGIAFVGLTTSSALIAPVIAASALLASVILRSRSLALGAAAFVAAPLLNAAAQLFGPAVIGPDGAPATTATAAFDLVLGVQLPMILLGLVALALAPRTIAGPAGVILGCAALATMAALLPGVLDLVHAVTGAGPVVWRLLIAAPVWVLVGMLVSTPFSGERSRSEDDRWALLAKAGPAVAAVVVIGVPLVFGTMLWQGPGASLTARPTWKVDQASLADVRALQDLGVPPGRWLLPPDQMTVLTIAAPGPYAVVPRSFYLPSLEASTRERADRALLFDLVSDVDVDADQVRGALERLDVSVACVQKTAALGERTLRRAVGGRLETVGNLRCRVV